MGNPVVHFEIGAGDHEPLARFYGELFGWKMQPIPPGNYILVDTQAGTGINGGIGKSTDGSPWVTFYVEADDLQAVLDRVSSLGGKTVVPVQEFPPVTFAMFADPDGVLVGLVKSPASGDQDEQGPSAGDGVPVDWFEVLGSDAERTQRFYSELFGWKVNDSGFGGYGLVDTGNERGIGGGLGAGGETRWGIVYANVDDVEASLARAEELGGKREYGPNNVDDHMQTGAIRDQAGNVFGVYSHRDH